MNKIIYKSRFTSNHLLPIFLAILIGVQVYFSNKIATEGEKLKFLEQEVIRLEDENQKLLAQNVNNISLYELAQKAQEFGFVEPEEIVNFSSDTSIAYQP